MEYTTSIKSAILIFKSRTITPLTSLQAIPSASTIVATGIETAVTATAITAPIKAAGRDKVINLSKLTKNHRKIPESNPSPVTPDKGSYFAHHRNN